VNVKVLSLLLLASLSAPQSSSTQQPTNAAESTISTDALDIYHDFLNSYADGNHMKVNLVRTTTILETRSGGPGDADSGCSKHFAPADLDKNHQQTHQFDPSVIKDWPVVLIDPDKSKIKDPEDAMRKGASVDKAVDAGFRAGQFSFSEIVFNQKHTMAIFTYSFWCGSLCGNGATVLVEKKNGKWVRSHEFCSIWMS
jgi:hypothetical protein